MKVLIVDDDAVARLIVEQNLRINSHPMESESAENGRAALTNIQDGFTPDVILLDLNMPVMNGFEFMEHMAQHNLHIPVYIITSSGLNEDKDKCDKYGFVQGYFSKPFNQVQVNEIVRAASVGPS